MFTTLDEPVAEETVKCLAADLAGALGHDTLLDYDGWGGIVREPKSLPCLLPDMLPKVESFRLFGTSARFMNHLVYIAIVLLICSGFSARAALTLIHSDDFEKGGGAWLPSDAKMWTVDQLKDGNHALHLHGKSSYQPPFRSPHSITLLKDKVVGDFVLTARVRTLQTTRGHRDMCIFFGFQNPSQFYYVHLGETPDPHSSQVFIVNQAPRTKITETPDIGVPWVNDQFHHVKVVRKVKSGLIEIYFDDMEKPQKVAHDKTFAWGAIGLGSFDDLGLWDDFRLNGVPIDKVVDQKFVSVKLPAKKKKKSQPGPTKAKISGSTEIVTVSASSTQSGHSPANVLDGRQKTKWAANGKGEWLQLEFNQDREVSQVGIGFIAGERNYDFELKGSLTGKDWKSLGKFQSPGKGSGVDNYEFKKAKMRFLRINVFGNNKNDWANIHAVKLDGVTRSASIKTTQPKADQPGQADPKLAAQAKTLKFVKWSGDIAVPDPVAISLDNQGRVFATQTQRRKANDLDIRSNRDWIPDDLGFTSVEDKRAHFKKHLSPENSEQNKKRVKDHNGDGSHDWKDLTQLTERIHLLEDTNGDGFADHMQVYAENFQTEITGIAAGVLSHNGDVYATIAPDVWRLRDTTGNGKADQREVIAHGFGLHIAYGGHDMHGLRVGPDGRIYWSIGDKGISVVSKEGKKFLYPNQGGVMRCDPDGSNFEVFAHGLRNVQEMAFDEHGNWFGVDNDSDSANESERFVYIVEGMDAGWRNNYQYRGSDFNPWTAEKIWIPWHENQPAYIVPPIRNYEDGPCGFVYNPGTALSPAYRNYFFMTEAPRGTQWAFQVRPKGASFEMYNSHPIGNGIAMTGLNFGPDGALYSVDWGGGYPLNQKGAVWKIDVPEHAQDAERVAVKQILSTGFRKLPLKQLDDLMAHIDQRVRLGAQFELVRRGETKTFDRVVSTGSPLAKIHAIWGLGQLARTKDDPLAKDLLEQMSKKKDPELQLQGIKMLADLKTQDVDPRLIVNALRSRNPRVQFHAAIAAGKLTVKPAFKPLLKIATTLTSQQTYLRHAIISGFTGTASAAQLAALQTHKSEFVRTCAVVALRRQNSGAVAEYLDDTSAYVATEAARAIHDDFSIHDALPKLALSLEAASAKAGERFVRRAINANYRLGKPEHATRVAQYALNTKADSAMRINALDALATWANPDLLDRVDGRRRHLDGREEKTIAKAITPALANLMRSSDNALLERAVALSTQYEIDLEPTALFALLRNTKAPDSLRVVALKGLQNDSAAGYALGSDSPGLRSEGARMLGKKNARAAAEYLSKTLANSKSLPEKQAALATLGTLKDIRASQVVGEYAGKLGRGELPAALHLDVIEAASSQNLTNQLTAYEKSRDPKKYPDNFKECLAGGDPVAGLETVKTHIFAQCVRCHKLDKTKGGSIIGPNLKNIGSKGRDYILHSMIDPNALVTKGYGTMNVTLKNGEVIGGQFRGETKTHIELRMPDRSSQKIKVGDVKERTPLISVMPTMGNILTKRELRNVIEYLAGLKDGSK
jgi:quinoprotein glucose dehydrogenase